MKDWKSQTEDFNQTTHESSGIETSSGEHAQYLQKLSFYNKCLAFVCLEIKLDMKLFLSILDEHKKTAQTLKEMLEEILKLLRNWTVKNDKDSETETTKNDETSTAVQTIEPPQQTDNNETLQAEETTIKSSNNQSDEIKVYTLNGFTLTIINKVQDFGQEIQERIFDTFNKVYPKMRERFNKEATKNVTLIVDSELNETAHTSLFYRHYFLANKTIKIHSAHFKETPLDTGTITHELMHVIHWSYRNSGPLWLIEGLADYARWKYGYDTDQEKLTNFESKHNYTDSYKVTARFLVWLEVKVNDTVVDRLNEGLQKKQYQNGTLWEEITQKSVDDLWNEYTKNPDLSK
ncbi:unnamed protein product [Adineta steineri]|uniref:Uncharacterized protein n=1 Tax=Adineta steineri TaxID=433720 RepID=A0A819DMD7_9BILA|nr:unnamed protein product [Adineta steineri]CAF3830894.1 unnamed protein product [Adineta steineri]